jgi:hypothetical protein
MRYWVFIVIIILLFVIIYFYPSALTEGFNPYLDYSRAYPALYALTKEYGPYNKSFFMYPEGYYDPNNPSVYPGNFRYNPGYGDYAYIPKHEYLKSWMGVGIGSNSETYPYPRNALEEPGAPIEIFPGINQNSPPTVWPKYNLSQDCIVPASLSEGCVNQKIQETGNLDLAIGACTVPSSISEKCWF